MRAMPHRAASERTSLLCSLPDFNNHESIGFDGGAARVGSRRGWSELCCGQVNRIGRAINVHGPRAGGRLHYLQHVELAILVAGHGQRAVAAAREGLATVETRGVNTRTDWHICQHLAVSSAHHDKLLRIPAADEEAMVL